MELADAPRSISIACDRNKADDLRRMQLVLRGWSDEYATVESLTESVDTVHLYPGAAKKAKT
jgi:hypothetical protein